MCRLRSIAAHRDHFVRRLSACPSVRLSGSHTFLIVTHSYVSQATHAFLGMLPLCYYLSVYRYPLLLNDLCRQIKLTWKDIPYIGNFSRREILAKMTLGWCVKFSLSPIFAISRTPNEYVKQGLFFTVSIFSELRKVANSAKIKPTRKIPDIRYTCNGNLLPYFNLSNL